MEKKPGSETGKTIFAVVLLLAMVAVVYFMVLKPKNPKDVATGAAAAANTAVTAAGAPASAGATATANGAAAPATAQTAAPTPGPMGPIVAPVHAELAPEAYFSKVASTSGTTKVIEDEYIAATENTRDYAKSTSAKDGDKAFAGGAYFTSVEIPPSPYVLKNPFDPLIKEKKGSTGGTATSPGGESSSYVSSPWAPFISPLPGPGETIPGTPGTGPGTGPVEPTGPPDENTLWIMGGEVILKGIALSPAGACALLELGRTGERKVVRVRARQIMEGRYQVAEIREDMVVVTDMVNGKVFELDLRIERGIAVPPAASVQG